MRALPILLIVLAACGARLDPPTRDAGDGKGAGAARDAGDDPAVDAGDPAVDAGDPLVPDAQVPLLVSPYGLFVEVSLDGVDHVLLQFDTGAAQDILDPDQLRALGLTGTRHQVKLGGIDLGTKDFQLLDEALAGGSAPGLPADAVIRGTAGDELFSDYSVGIDYRTSTLWLTRARSAELGVPHPADVGAPREVPIERPYDLIVTKCGFGDGGADQDCLFDTGSYDDVALGPYWSTLSPPSARTVPTFAAQYDGSLIQGFYQRAAAAHIGPNLAITAPAVAVFPSFPVLEDVAAAIHRPLVGLIGRKDLFDDFVAIDYPNDRILAFPTPSPSGMGVQDFWGYGLVLAADQSGGVEVDVVAGSDAEQQGARTGDVLVGIGGGDYEITSASLIAGQPGEHRTFQLQRGDAELDLDIAAEDLLPAVP